MNWSKNFILVIFALSISISVSAKKINILLVTGGHGFEQEPFFAMFDSFKNISYTKLEQPEANKLLGTIEPRSFDVVVFYDMPKTISGQDKLNYQKLTEKGKGLVFLHHSLASYQQWDEYKTFIGGKYHEEKGSPQSSSYQHDVDFEVKIVDSKHPVTKGISNFMIHDEVYGKTEVLPDVVPLLTTNHELSSQTIGWTLKKGDSRIVYIQPGHDHNAYSNPSYRQLVKQAIEYVAK